MRFPLIPPLVILALTGCVSDKDVEAGKAVSGAASVAKVSEFTTPGGTRCVALIGPFKAALSCDWGDRP